MLYLKTEAAGVRSTGIGCYFDDVVHQLLSIDLLDDTWQSHYHFTVDGAVEDDRLTTLPAYGHLPPSEPHRAVVAPKLTPSLVGQERRIAGLRYSP